MTEFNTTAKVDLTSTLGVNIPHGVSICLGCAAHIALLGFDSSVRRSAFCVSLFVASVATFLTNMNADSELSFTLILFVAPIVFGGAFQLLNWFIHGCINLFFNKKFQYHRLMGLVYLGQFTAALVWYFWDYQTFAQSHLVWSLPLNGVMQSITATYYFSFLPKKVDPGYYSDRGALAYDFVKENIFFALILLWQWLYMTNWILPFVPMIIENGFVFLPYVGRLAFPQTRFRDSQNSSNNKTDANRLFFWAATAVTKLFYIWAKHFIGFFLNYARFLDRLSNQQIQHIYLMLILSCSATTISMFLHTLAFRHYISKKTSFILYMISYLSTFYSWYKMTDIFVLNLDLCLIVLGGIAINFKSRRWQYAYQVLVMVLLNGHRMGWETHVLRSN